MRGRLRKIILFFFVGLFTISTSSAFAWTWGDNQLVSVNEKAYSMDDFRLWWKIWKPEGMAFPDTPAPYIEWILMSDQAQAMELYNNPEFRRKMDVFIKVRAMMMLKNEEVDSKINISDSEIKTFYDKNYTPVWEIQVLAFDTLENAQKCFEAVKPFSGNEGGKLPFVDYHGIKREDGGPVGYTTATVRPFDLSKQNKDSWTSALRKLQKFEFSEPIKDDTNRYVVIRVDNLHIPDKEDLQNQKPNILSKLRKGYEQKLTNELLKKLISKFEVDVDKDLLKSIDIDTDYPLEFLNQPLIKTKIDNIPVGYVISSIKKELKFRKKIGFSPEKIDDFKNTIVNGLITQTLITWESVDRHYEEKEPLKDVYQFYRRNRLVKTLERKLKKDIVITDEQAKKYYEENKKEYSTEPKAKVIIFQDEEKIVKKIWVGVLQGIDFSEHIKEVTGSDPKLTTKPINKFPTATQEVLKNLVKGEVSAPFKSGEKYFIVKLVDRNDEIVKSFDQVKNSIINKLQEEEFSVARNKYVSELMGKSDIVINNDNWLKIKKEYMEKNNGENY